MPALFFKMIILQPDTANQTVYLTLDEGRQYFATAFTHYLMIIKREENSAFGLDLAQVATITAENARYTTLTITTVGLSSGGFYSYEVYGQNSDSNLSPTNGAVVGLVEQGTVLIETPTIFVNQNAATQDDYRSGQE